MAMIFISNKWQAKGMKINAEMSPSAVALLLQCFFKYYFPYSFFVTSSHGFGTTYTVKHVLWTLYYSVYRHATIRSVAFHDCPSITFGHVTDDRKALDDESRGSYTEALWHHEVDK